MMSYDRALRTVYAVTWTILVLMLMLRSDVRQPHGIPGIDKVAHFIAFALMAFFWYRWLLLCFNNPQSLAITVYKPFLISNEELSLSLLITLQVLIQASLWTLNASQLMRGPELLSVQAERSLQEIENLVPKYSTLATIMDSHRRLLITSRQGGIMYAIEPRMKVNGNEKTDSIGNILDITKLLTEQYRILKQNLRNIKGSVSQEEIVNRLKKAPTFGLTQLSDNVISIFAELIRAESLDRFREIFRQYPNIIRPETISDLTSIESGDTRGIISCFNSVEVIRILSLAYRDGPTQAIETLERDYKYIC